MDKNLNNITYINGILIVNKTYSLPSTFVTLNPLCKANKNNKISFLDEETYQSFLKMQNDAINLGLSFWIASGYRSFRYQKELYDNYIKKYGAILTDTFSARPGHSEHQTGFAIDLNTITDDFQYTKEYAWLNKNAYKYGFIIRYPKNKEKITGYKYEPWHIRYVGTKLSKILFNNGNWITIEEYFKIESKYKD